LISPLLGGVGGLMSFAKLIAAHTKVFPIIFVDQILRDFEGAFFFVDMKSKDDKMCKKKFLYEHCCLIGGEAATLVEGLKFQDEPVYDFLDVSGGVFPNVVPCRSESDHETECFKGDMNEGCGGINGPQRSFFVSVKFLEDWWSRRRRSGRGSWAF
jgi:hypothetical protein